MIIIRNATADDVKSIVKIHQSAFDGFFLTSLGSSFLEFYYSCFIKSKETITLCAENDGTIIGFAAASKACNGFNGRLIKQNLFAFGVLSVKLLFTTPSSLLRLAKNLTKKGDSVEDDENYAELFSIGVLSSAQGSGVGRRLIDSVEREMKMCGVEKISLTTDYYDNDKAVKFYNSMGYVTLYEFVTYPERKMFRFIKTL